MVPPVLPDAVACFPDAVCAVLLRPERFLCRVTEQSIEDADAAKHLPGSLFHNGPLVVVRVRVKGGPCRQQTYALLRDGRKMYAYRFAGYWRDVGTIDSLWEANMEVLDPENSGIDIFDKTWKIYSRNPVLPAQKIGPRAVVQDSLVTEGCKIYGTVKHSVLSAGVVVEEGATVEDAVLMDGVVVKAGAVVKRCILAEDVVVGAGAKVGGDGPIAHVGTGLTVGAGATVKEGAKVFESVKEGVEVC